MVRSLYLFFQLRLTHLLCLIFLLLTSLKTNSQIIFTNPSFEGTPMANFTPFPWDGCGGTPDTGPIPLSTNGVNPSHGSSCIGMINNLTLFERIGQLLPFPMDTLSCYQFDIDIKYLPTYISNCNPGVLRIWLGNSRCQRDYLAWNSPIINHTAYRTYSASFTSPQNYTHVTFDLDDSLSSTTNVCMVFDNIHNEVIKQANVELGNDTTLCPGQSLLLNTGVQNGSYLWQDNSTDSVFRVTSEGLYTVLVTDAEGCRGTDSIYVTYENKLDLGSDTILCGKDSLLISSNLQSPGISYQWQDNSRFSNFLARDSGWYTLTTTSIHCIQTDSILVEIISNPQLDLGADTALCLGQSFTLDASVPGATSYRWSNNSTGSQLITNTSGNYAVTVSINGCEFVDSINLSFEPLPSFDLGIDTFFCLSDTLSLNAPFNPAYRYLWSDNSSTSGLRTTIPGVYWVDVFLGNCKVSDTIQIDFQSFSTQNPILSRDTILCLGDSLRLDASTAGGIFYLWQDLSTNPQFLVSQSGTYNVSITDGVCDLRDTIQVDYSNLTPFSLGKDTILCPNEELVLIPPFDPNYNYLWQDLSTNSTFNVTQAGLYTVRINEGNCSEIDSIQISFENFDPMELNIGNDTVLCPGDSLMINGSVSWGITYLWQDNLGSSSRTIRDPGQYILNVSTANCVVSDTINISYSSFLQPNLGQDTSICLNDSLILAYPAISGVSYLWQDGSTQNVLIAKSAGTYWLRITQGNCEFSDTIVLSLLNTAAPRPRLGKDTNLCEGVQLILDATNTVQSNYLWHDGSTGPTFVASGLKDSLYYVTVREGVCVGRDSILVGGIAASRIQSESDSLCLGRSQLLFVSPPEGIHTWQDGSRGRFFTASEGGKYFVESTKAHCIFTDSVSIELKDCNCRAKVPSVFTPNGDGINDQLKLELDCDFSAFEIVIYNRNGRLIYKTTEITNAWDGTFQNAKVSDGVYFYVLKFFDEFNSVETTKKGSISVFH